MFDLSINIFWKYWNLYIQLLFFVTYHIILLSHSCLLVTTV